VSCPLQPDIALWNAGNPILYTLSQNPFIVRSDGRVNWGRPGVFEAACNFKVRMYLLVMVGRLHCCVVPVLVC
jgi:hypothetical protein